MNSDALIEGALGIPLQKSPVYTAKALLEDCYKGMERKIRDTTWDLRTLPFYEAARDLLWRRALDASMIGKTVHCFDKNSTYLSACSSTNTGIGDPVHRVFVTNDGTPTLAEPEHGLPGIYRISWDEPHSSQIVIEPDQEWVTCDVLEFALSRKFRLRIHEAWVFPDYDRILGSRHPERNWALRIWTARQSLKAADEVAYAKMKTIALVGVGSFATSQEKYSGLHLIHPNWWGDVVGKARVNMLANLEKLAQTITPVLVYSDGLWFVTRDANPRTAVPGILDRMDKLGGYRHEYSFTLTEDMVRESEGMKEGSLVTLFHRAAKRADLAESENETYG